MCVGPSAGSRRSDDAIKQKSRSSPFVSDCLKSSGEAELSSHQFSISDLHLTQSFLVSLSVCACV